MRFSMVCWYNPAVSHGRYRSRGQGEVDQLPFPTFTARSRKAGLEVNERIMGAFGQESSLFSKEHLIDCRVRAVGKRVPQLGEEPFEFWLLSQWALDAC